MQFHSVYFFVSLLKRRLSFTLFPYTTLFRSRSGPRAAVRDPGRAARSGRAEETGRPRTEGGVARAFERARGDQDRKSTRLNSSHLVNSYAVFCLNKKNIKYADTNESIKTDDA